MAKDPAFLFYPGDWLGGTMGMTFEEKGAYIELLMSQFNRGKMTLDHIKRTLSGSFDSVWPTLKDKFNCEGGFYFNQRLLIEQQKRSKFTESRRNSRLKADEDQVKLYLILDNDTKYYKIGSSVNPLRRFAEMTNQKKPAITVGQRNYSLFWVSEIVSRSEEKKAHSKFSEKRIIGEWFSLTIGDILYLKKSYGTISYEKRTENENENESKNINENKEGGMGEEKFIVPQMCKLWYETFPTYTADKESDFLGMGKVLWFIVKQHHLKKVEEPDTQIKILNTVQLIADQVNREPFWVNKPIKSIANNIQEFYNKIKNPVNGKSDSTTPKTNGYYSKTAGQDVFAKRFEDKLSGLK